MKYKVGDKVKYDGGDWWFYGTVSAVFEHAICPCYRLNVERMEKKNCKLSITQFEFELEPDIEANNIYDNRKWDNPEIEFLQKFYGVLNIDDLSKFLKRSSQAIESKWLVLKTEKEIKVEPEPELNIIPDQDIVELPQPPKKGPSRRKTGEAWNRNMDMYLRGEKNNSVSTWVYQNRKQYQLGQLSEEKAAKLVEIKFPFESVKRKPKTPKTPKKPRKQLEASEPKIGEAWDRNLEMFKKGVRNNIIFNWISLNRRQYKTGILSDEKFGKLVDINFPFESGRKRVDEWNRNFELWKQGERNTLQLWRQRNVKLYVDGRLDKYKIEKLKEIGILK